MDRSHRQTLVRTQIGENCSVGELCLVAPGTRITDGATIADSSQMPPDVRVVTGDWGGNPAKKIDVMMEADVGGRDIVGPARFLFWFVLAPFVWATSFGAGAVVFLRIADDVSLFIAVLLLWIPLTVSAFVPCILAVMFKWLILGRVREGSHRAKGWFAARKLVVDNFVSLSLHGLGYAQQVGSLAMASQSVKLSLLRALGAKVAYRTFVVNTMRDTIWTQYDLLEIHEGSFAGAASGLSCYDASGSRIRRVKTKLGKKCYLGATAFVAPGSILDDGSTVAACSSTMKDQHVPSHTLVIGYGRMIKNSLDAAAAGDIGELTQARVEHENALVFATSTAIGCAMVTGYVVICYSLVVSPKSNDPVTLSLWLCLLLIIIIFGAVPYFVLVRIGIKGFLVGTHQEGYFEVGSQIWRSHLTDLNIGIGIRPTLLLIIGGTPYENLYQKLLGANIEPNVHLDGAYIHEPDLVTIQEGTVMEEYATLSPHDLRPGGLKLAPVFVSAEIKYEY